MKFFLHYFVLVSLMCAASYCQAQPTVTIVPTNQMVISGDTAFFSATISTNGYCAGDYNFQWLFDGSDIISTITTAVGNGTNGYRGDLGPATGCAGNLCFAPERENPLFEHGLKKALNALHDNGYVGMIDLNAIATDGEVFGLEWTPRIGYEGTCNVTHLLQMEFGKFIRAIAANEPLQDLTARHSFSATVRLSIPPYPNEPHEPGMGEGIPRKFYHEGIPVEGMNRRLLTSFYAMDLRVNEKNDDLFETAGVNGFLGAAIGCGETIGMAFDHVKQVIDAIRVPNLQYRTDIRKETARRYMELESNGWLRPRWGD